MRVLAFLVLFLVFPGASASAQTPAPGAIPSSTPGSTPPSPADGRTPATRTADCVASYPPIAVRLNQQGTTVLMVHVTAEGTVGDVRVQNSSGHEALDAAAVKCAQSWTFRPATRNEIPVEANTEFTIRCSLMGGTPPPPIPFAPRGSPVGWELDQSTAMGGFLASYKLSEMPVSEEYLSARAYPNISNLGVFVSEVDANLNAVRGLHLLSEGPITLCNGESASEIEYSQPGLVAANPARILDIEQVRTVKNGWAYVTTYIRPAENAKRPDAEQWIHAYCGSDPIR